MFVLKELGLGSKGFLFLRGFVSRKVNNYK